MIRFFLRSTRIVVVGAIVLVCGASTVRAEFSAQGLIKHIGENTAGQQDVFAADPLATGANFSPGDNTFIDNGGLGPYFNTEGALMGNDVLVTTQEGLSTNSGLGFTLSMSNGENGDGLGPAGVSNYGYFADADNLIVGSNPSNPVAADPAFAAIGNTSGRLEDGNVIRLSTWVRLDPDAPITVEPQVPPLLKLEFYRDALSGWADTNPGKDNPDYGSRIFDTDQNDSALIDPDDKKRVLDIDGNLTNNVPATEPTVGQAWQQIVHTYQVDSLGTIKAGNLAWDIDPFGSDATFATGSDPAIVEDVTFVEEIRGVMFMGDWMSPADLGGPGNLLWDNALIEVFKSPTEEGLSDVLTSNPSPVLDEMNVITDFNTDGATDGQDFLIWQRGYDPTGGTSTNADGDANFDTFVDGADLGLWAGDYGSGALAAAAVSGVPEPSSALLMALAGLFCLRRAARQGR